MNERTDWQVLTCPNCGRTIQIHRLDSNEVECHCQYCEHPFTVGEARSKSKKDES